MVDPTNHTFVTNAFAAHAPALVDYASRLLHDRERARDVVQETFIRLCRQPPASVDGRLAEWLFTVTRNIALDTLRKERKMIAFDPGLEPEKVKNNNTGSIESNEGFVRLIAALPAEQREILSLKFKYDLSYREIRQITGHSESNIGFLVFQAMKTLRGRFREASEACPARGGALQA